ncbi:DUF1127 domain-containing protein [Rhizobium sp. BK376]|uniref:DUF1127 domain-containing protein n=1 Tax=Rhizobium sp. BK376 TaxID=2512149 RepID=UPI001FDF0751|nr:DUF1127 domain-containing protein [Rhizobium sp. BK376]
MAMDTINTIERAAHQSRPRAASLSLKGVFHRFCHLLWTWYEKRESRRTLRDLTDDQLNDIGITRREARTEVSKSFFWD